MPSTLNPLRKSPTAEVPTSASSARTQQGLTKEGELRLRGKLRSTVVVLALLLVIGLFVALSSLDGARSEAFVWALACLAIGFIAGFLFAVPRVNRSAASRRKLEQGLGIRRGQPREASSSERGFGLGINTNLEEISDWLTKILVGLGLVQLRSIPSYVQRVGYFVAQGLGTGKQSVASGLVLYFLGLGFVCGYLLTRMFIGPAFRLADQATAIGLAEGIAQIAVDAQEQSLATPDLYDVLDAAYATLIDNRQRQSAKPPENRTPLPADVTASYIKELEKFRRDPRWALNRRLHLLLGGFYKQRREFDRAIAVLTAFIVRKQAVEAIDIHLADALYNRACYYALESGKDPNNTERAVSDLRESLKILPSNATEASTDGDFDSIKETPQFKSALGQR